MLLWILYICFFIIKLHDVRADLTDISAQTFSLMCLTTSIAQVQKTSSITFVPNVCNVLLCSFGFAWIWVDALLAVV